MVLFFPIQQELDCINQSGEILGKIVFDAVKDEHLFKIEDGLSTLSPEDEALIAVRIAGLNAGAFMIPMQDDD
ncbi:hypothetical protein [Neptunomonas marina]|uniref:Uncharacterized protein n=1 Tax=Neptunomonas marina TaxID=1815562 RepID=A0A437QDX2_9GAMM|nr:hypothetical protein [Neptunomonas marina]RVU32740.1 hypothetical protein EOE65_03530 [Neptunomonas marina]